MFLEAIFHCNKSMSTYLLNTNVVEFFKMVDMLEYWDHVKYLGTTHFLGALKLVTKQ